MKRSIFACVISISLILVGCGNRLRTLEDCIKALGTKQTGKAIEKLVGMGDAATEYIDSHFEDFAGKVQYLLIDVLYQIGSPKAVEALINRIYVDDKNGCTTVMSKISCLKNKAIPTIKLKYDAADAKTKRELITILGWMQTDEALDALNEIYVKTKDPYLLSGIVGSLCNFPSEKSAEILRKQMISENENVAIAAIESLGEIKDKGSIEKLKSILSDEGKSLNRRIYCAGTLAILGEKSGKEFLMSQLVADDRGGLFNTIWNISKLQDPSFIEALIPHLKNADPSIRSTTARALGATKDSRATKPLIDLLADTEDGVRWQAVVSLRWINDEEAKQALKEHAKRERNKGILEQMGIQK